jgi:hypothetical protein
MEKLRATDVKGRVYEFDVNDNHADVDSIVKEHLNYGCGCEKDHGKTSCDKRFVKVEVLKQAR